VTGIGLLLNFLRRSLAAYVSMPRFARVTNAAFGWDEMLAGAP